ncbi:MAG: hypothetical protein U1E76_07565 [Planctomycetota bacterium]
MEARLEQQPDLHLRRVQIRSWESDVARQYRIKSLPYLKLYGAAGDLIADGTREVLQAIR